MWHVEGATAAARCTWTAISMGILIDLTRGGGGGASPIDRPRRRRGPSSILTQTPSMCARRHREPIFTKSLDPWAGDFDRHPSAMPRMHRNRCTRKTSSTKLGGYVRRKKKNRDSVILIRISWLLDKGSLAVHVPLADTSPSPSTPERRLIRTRLNID